MLEFVQDEFETLARIKVIGVGGGGSNAVKRMIEEELANVEFYVVNTDHQALLTCHNAERIWIGKQTTGGLGAGADPEKGRRAAEEDKEHLKNIVEGANMVFVTAGMGGGTGTGAAPIVADLARGTGALTIGVVTRPFDFEGSRRSEQAIAGVEEMRQSADSVIVIPNQRLVDVIDRNLPINAAFRMGDEVLLHAVKSISDLITIPGEINLDFADVKTIMSNGGSALMGIGIASGDNRAQIAAQNAISSPLLEESTIEGATGIIANITGPPDMMMHELEAAMEVIRESSDTEQLIFGLAYKEDLHEEIQVTVIATGFDARDTSRPRASQGDVMTLEDFFGRGSSQPNQSRFGRGTPSAAPRQQNPRNRPNFVRNPRSMNPQNQGEPLQPNLDDNVDDVLDLPTFLRVRNSREKKS